MKHTIRWILVSALVCVICSAVAFSVAYHRGYKRGYWKGVDSGIAQGSFSESLGFFTALQILRSGDVPRATRSMETQCFASAKIYYNNPTLGSDSDIALAKGLSVYRAAYRTNSADWDDWERKLEVQLAKIKSNDYKAWNSIIVKP